MLFIYGALVLGGIETFFVRMAKERYQQGLDTSILLMAKEDMNNSKLLEEMSRYAKVYFLRDIFHTGSMYRLVRNFPLLLPMRKNKVRELLKNVEQIHSNNGMFLLLGYLLSRKVDKNISITFGSYHYLQHNWEKTPGCLPYYEKINRDFVFEYLPRNALLFFSEGNREFYTRKLGLDFSKSKTFRLGVVDQKPISVTGGLSFPLRICAVGRFVALKTYNLFMLDVIRVLADRGIPVVFDIYGYGELEKKIRDKIEELKLDELVFIKGAIEYSEFDSTISQYDLFVGSGTAIIQAASLGVPCITGVEGVVEPKTYGYFSEVYNYEYNLKDIGLPYIKITDLITSFINLNEPSRAELKRSHIEAIKGFTNKYCQESMESSGVVELPFYKYRFNRWLYEISRFVDYFRRKLDVNHPAIRKP